MIRCVTITIACLIVAVMVAVPRPVQAGVDCWTTHRDTIRGVETKGICELGGGEFVECDMICDLALYTIECTYHPTKAECNDWFDIGVYYNCITDDPECDSLICLGIIVAPIEYQCHLSCELCH